jgi:hypothetical protein
VYSRDNHKSNFRLEREPGRDINGNQRRASRKRLRFNSQGLNLVWLQKLGRGGFEGKKP